MVPCLPIRWRHQQLAKQFGEFTQIPLMQRSGMSPISQAVSVACKRPPLVGPQKVRRSQSEWSAGVIVGGFRSKCFFALRPCGIVTGLVRFLRPRLRLPKGEALVKPIMTLIESSAPTHQLRIPKLFAVSQVFSQRAPDFLIRRA
jgi:hypothetical protein